MPRLGHKKSRNGCRQCKARHVKCDESKPCSNCARHGVICSLVDPNAPHQAPAAISSSSVPKRGPRTLVEKPNKEPDQIQASSSSVGSIIQPFAETTIGMTPSEGESPSSGSDNFPFITRFVIDREPVHANLWLKDLELMHHWMGQAIDTLSRRPEFHRMWRGVGTKLAASFPYLMHEILAFSALHLAVLEPNKSKEHFALGVHHQDLALRGLRQALKNITEENASPLLATSLLLTVSVWASRAQEALEPGPDTKDAIDDLVDIFALNSGVTIIMKTHQMVVLRGPFHPIFQDNMTETPSQPLFTQLLEHLPTLTTTIEKHTSIDEETRSDLLGAVINMRVILLRSCRPCEDNRELKFLYLWPLHLSPQVTNQLRQKEESALALLLFYSVGLYAAEPRYWFMEGWADRTMRTISEHIKDPDWRMACTWPLQLMERLQSTPPLQTPNLAAPTVE